MLLYTLVGERGRAGCGTWIHFSHGSFCTFMHINDMHQQAILMQNITLTYT